MESELLFPQKTTMSILKICAREIFDSRGNPTVEVDLYTSKGMYHLGMLERPMQLTARVPAKALEDGPQA